MGKKLRRSGPQAIRAWLTERLMAAKIFRW
jgi:hypothetical protein